MDYQTPQQMRASLSHVLNDDALIEATIKQHFDLLEQKSKAPVVRIKRAATHEEQMAIGSSALGEAIARMLHGRVAAVPNELQWHHETGLESSGTKNIRDEAAPYRAAEREAVDVQSRERKRVAALVAPSPEPCFRCGAARGCEHTA